MKVRILLFDDIFSPLFRKSLSAEQLVWDDNWVSALEQLFTDPENGCGISFELIKSGEIDAWQGIINREKPDALLIDLFWPEEAGKKFGDRSRGIDIALDAIASIKTAFPELPIVCHTVKPGPEIMHQVYGAGATFFMEKVSLPLPEVQSPLKYIMLHQLGIGQSAPGRRKNPRMKMGMPC